LLRSNYLRISPVAPGPTGRVLDGSKAAFPRSVDLANPRRYMSALDCGYTEPTKGE
jgi:hypothetical protein